MSILSPLLKRCIFSESYIWCKVLAQHILETFQCELVFCAMVLFLTCAFYTYPKDDNAYKEPSYKSLQ